MANIEDYKKQVDSVDNSSSNKQSVDYYKMAKDQEYSTLLDKEIQLENAKAAALRHTNNQMAAQGLSSQGYGNSFNTGVYGKYMQAVDNAQSTYNTNIKNIDKQQYDDEQNKANDRFQSITTMLTQATDMNQMNSLLEDYGYGSYVTDNNGNNTFQFNNKPEGMSDDDWYQLKYYYNLQKKTIEESATPQYAANYGNLDSWKAASYITSSGKTKNIGDNFKYESQNLWAKINAGEYDYGTTIKLQNSSGDIIYVQWTQNGLRMVNKEAYDNSSNKDSLVWKQNVNK